MEGFRVFATHTHTHTIYVGCERRRIKCRKRAAVRIVPRDSSAHRVTVSGLLINAAHSADNKTDLYHRSCNIDRAFTFIRRMRTGILLFSNLIHLVSVYHRSDHQTTIYLSLTLTAITSLQPVKLSVDITYI